MELLVELCGVDVLGLHPFSLSALQHFADGFLAPFPYYFLRLFVLPASANLEIGECVLAVHHLI